MGSVIARSLVLMSVLKLLGGAFLLSVAYHALKARRSDYTFITDLETGSKAQNSFAKEFALGLFSGLSNPKSIIFYLSLFSVILTPNVSPALSIVLGVWMSLLVSLWNAAIVLVLSGRRVRAAFGKAAFYIDKLVGVLLGLIGLKLLQSALQRDP